MFTNPEQEMLRSSLSRKYHTNSVKMNTAAQRFPVIPNSKVLQGKYSFLAFCISILGKFLLCTIRIMEAHAHTHILYKHLNIVILIKHLYTTIYVFPLLFQSNS